MKVYISDDDMCTTQKLNLARVQKWLEANGCSVISEPKSADHVICMTCNGWALLEEKSYERIGNLAKIANDKMIVVGCVVDAHPAKVEEIWGGPVVKTRSDGPLSFAGIEDLFPHFEVSLKDIPAQSEFRSEADYRDTSKIRKFVNIAEGCSFACSFCTHKPGLGPRRSRTLDDILEQFQSFENEQVDVVHLMGMETGLWGLDFGMGYPDLLQAVIDMPGTFEIHVAQFQPHGLKLHGQRLVDVFSHRRVTDIQLPIQSTSDRIMKMMNRKNHAAEISGYLQEIRNRNTRVVLRTDVIVGWPTETAEERMRSLSYAAAHFDEVATYAIELHPDLPAWKYKDDAFSPEELQGILEESRSFLESQGVVAHSGQQDDATMVGAEEKRVALRESKAAEAPDRSTELPFVSIDALMRKEMHA
jgi:tRNA A37 methylthiotransferase MiaB